MQHKRIKKISTFKIRSVEQYLSWLLWCTNTKALALKDFQPYLRHLDLVFKTRGVKAGIDYSKSVRANVMNFLSGSPLRLEGHRLTNRDRLPVCLGPLLNIVRDQDPVKLRLVMTVLFSTRILRTKPEADIEPIISPLDKGADISLVTMFAQRFWFELGYHHPNSLSRKLRFNRFHFTTKSGPNGHALSTWGKDLFNLPDRLVDLIKTLGGSKMEKFLDTALGSRDIISGFLPTDKGRSLIRKLSCFPDREGKTRVIAIGDYFSQTVLKGLHDFLLQALKKIPQDCTMNQDGFKAALQGSEIYYSVDLKSATDRFPIKVIGRLLSGHLPLPYVKAWESIMVEFPFRFNNSDIKYQVGNPMGFYSSWTSFALTHHYIIYYCCRLLGKDWKSLPYCLVGDDVVIGNKDVGDKYLSVMKSLGVEVSMNKTHRSKTTYEFAKRWIHKGQEISPFPLSALQESMKSSSSMASLLLIEQSKKGWIFDKDISFMVARLYGIVNRFPSRLRRKLSDNAYISEQIFRIIWGLSPAGETMSSLSRRMGYSLPPLNDTVGVNLLSNIAVELFANSNEQLKSHKGKPLGDLATGIVMYLTSFEDEPKAFELLDNPTLHAYGSIEAKYIEAMKLAKKIDTVMQGEWPMILKSLAIPLTDEVFSVRSPHVLSSAVSRIGHHLKNRFETLEAYPQLLT